jgi:hypothetical protein
MQALDEQRSRLRAELRQAYTSWLATSESCGAPHEPVDVSGCRLSVKAKWFQYLAAKERLVVAYAEQPSTA